MALDAFLCVKKHEFVSQSTAEVELIAATAEVNQGLWIKKIFCDLRFEMKESTEIFVDNQAAIAISHNLVFHRDKAFRCEATFS